MFITITKKMSLIRVSWVWEEVVGALLRGSIWLSWGGWPIMIFFFQFFLIHDLLINWDVLKVIGWLVSPQPCLFLALSRAWYRVPGSSLSSKNSNICLGGSRAPVQLGSVFTMLGIFSLFSPYVSKEGELGSWTKWLSNFRPMNILS